MRLLVPFVKLVSIKIMNASPIMIFVSLAPGFMILLLSFFNRLVRDSPAATTNIEAIITTELLRSPAQVSLKVVIPPNCSSTAQVTAQVAMLNLLLHIRIITTKYTNSTYIIPKFIVVSPCLCYCL